MKRLILTAVSFLYAIALAAQPEARIAAGPWLQAVAENEFTVMWLTDTSAVSWVEIAPDDGTHFYAAERTKYYQSVFGRRPVGTLHSVRITGLAPATTYRYRIMMQGAYTDGKTGETTFSLPSGSRVYKREPFRATTLDHDKETVRFAVGNDFHDNRDAFKSAFGGIKPGTYDFVMLNGDMTSCLYSEKTIVDGYLKSASEMFASDTPLFVARGNHENRGPFAVHFMDYFPSSTGQPYYAFRQGPAFFIVLDCGEDKPDSDIEYGSLTLSDPLRRQEAQWLETVLQSDEFRNAPVKIVFCHMAPTQNGWHGENEINRLFVPMLNKAGIDLMLCGHIHAYKLEDAHTNGHEFPVLCNPNLTRLDASVTASDIRIEIFDKNGTRAQELSFKK